MEKEFTCHNCGQTKPINYAGGTGFARYLRAMDDFKLCYQCCAIGDALTMAGSDSIVLYLHDGKVSNWPGTLSFVPSSITKGRHNMARFQYSVRFTAFGNEWTGRQVGDQTEILRCRRVKGTR